MHIQTPIWIESFKKYNIYLDTAYNENFVIFDGKELNLHSCFCISKIPFNKGLILWLGRAKDPERWR